MAIKLKTPVSLLQGFFVAPSMGAFLLVKVPYGG